VTRIHSVAGTLQPGRPLRSGWNAKQVQLLLGHHSPAFTLATYVHLLPDDLPEPDFLDGIGEVVGRSTPSRFAMTCSDSGGVSQLLE
jgi:hypothetical protein